MKQDLRQLLDRLLDDPRTSFSVGCLGAIAEYHWEADEPSQRIAPLGRANAHGHVLVDGLERFAQHVRGAAWLDGAGHDLPWRQSFELVVPEDVARGKARDRITRVREDDEGVWFDMGIGASNLDAYVVASNGELVDELDRAAGTRFVADGNTGYAAVKRFSPPRVFRTCVAEVRVDQRIPSRERAETAPHGPHTHVLRGLLAGGARAAASAPARPAGTVPVLGVHTPHPMADEMGRLHDYDANDFAAFDALLDAFAPRDWLAERDALFARADGGPRLATVDRRVARPVLAILRARGWREERVAELAAEWGVHSFATSDAEA
jgi:hypothetical protein